MNADVTTPNPMTPVIVSQCINAYFDTPVAAGVEEGETSFDRTLRQDDVDDAYDPPTDVSANAGADSFLLPAETQDVRDNLLSIVG